MIWDDETEARFREWEKAPERPWNRPAKAPVFPSVPLDNLVSKIPDDGGGRGRPKVKVSEALIAMEDVSLTVKAGFAGVSRSTIARRRRAWKKTIGG